ncbi:MRC1-like domain-containing protein [Cadophora sp. MPI-SDFR-AT-0126]|nr:MRC1-like domain-containing protein [Leotiomycetes sp. MPI-SDFR-AT-0126]
MASTRESSPASESGAMSPTQLTPNSKVKAMLAAFDKESDDESVSGSARPQLTMSLPKTTPSTSTNHETIEKEQSNKDTAMDSASDDDDDEDDIFRPKGRVAAMMQANEDSSEEDQPSAETARERVKKMLMAKRKSPEPAPNTEKADGSDENDTPVVSRKRKLRVARQDTPKSSPPRRSASPSLFVSPAKSSRSADAASDSDVELPDAGNSRFMALVEKKRQERLAREDEAAKEKAKKAEEKKRYAQALDDEDDVEDSEGERRLTQSSRPSRKASKKALEEMHRETQRLSRNQQLAHYATTKKKFTKADFFAKFTKKPKLEQTPEPARPTSSSSAAPHSDFETKDTPPTSPASPAADTEKAPLPSTPRALAPATGNDENELPALEEALVKMQSSPPIKLDKGNGKATEEPISEIEVLQKPLSKQRTIRVRAPKLTDHKASPLDDSDSDLEIIAVKPSSRKERMDSIFDRVPAKLAKESHSLHALRMLAQVTSPGKQNSGRNFGRDKKPSMTTSEMQMSLQQRARQQAAREREERLQALRDKGVIIQTAEEREREAAEVDDMVARARLEGEEIAKREKAAAKRERKANGEADPLGEDSSDDEDWQESKEIPEDDEVSLSGSEEEVDDEEEEELVESGEDGDGMELDGEELDTKPVNPMFDNEADETDEDEAEAEANLSIDEDMADDGDVEDEDGDLSLTLNRKARRSRHAKIISDDEDELEEDQVHQTPVAPQIESPPQLSTKSPLAPNSVLRSATKTFIPGLTVAGPAGLGLTQIFAGTMDDSQAFGPSPTALDAESQQVESNQDSLAFLRRLRAPDLPPFVPTLEADTQDADMVNQSQVSHIPESQPAEETQSQNIQLHFSQSQVHEFDSLVHDTQLSQMFEATQDVGFQHMTPVKGRFLEAPPSTVDTVILEPTALPETMAETPVVKKKGKLRQRAHIATFSDEEDAGEEEAVEEDDFELTANAFDVMRKSFKKKADKKVEEEFDKKKSKAKEMVNEQAEESEDEYAGLGGASDDESGAEDDALVKEMINDAGGEHFDAGKLAAIHADRERVNDEKQIEKLYKDITNGMLRRKRGADYDLSDSDDGGEARQRRKRKEFAKMRKALLADERIGKIAENPKRQAFLRAIEDRGSEDEMDFLEDFPEQEEGLDSQSQSQGEDAPQVVPDSQPTSMGPPKRKYPADASYIQNRAPPHLRRTKPNKKPSNLSEIRESLSSLIEEPNAVLGPGDSDSDSEDELEIEGGEDIDLGPSKEKNKENRDPFALRRTNVPIVDRISLKRASSSSVSNSAKLAFAVSSSTPGFKVPPLLRRATTNNSIASSTSSSVSGGMSGTERMAGGSGNDGVKRGGGKNSGVNYFARESERRAAVVKTEKRREMKMVKGAKDRRKVVGGLFGAGKFE